MIDGYGNISFWGYSPSINLLETGKAIILILTFLLMFIFKNSTLRLYSLLYPRGSYI